MLHKVLSMSRTTTPIVLVPEERATLDAWGRGRNLPYRKVIRARIITMAADGVLNQDIAHALSVSRPTVQLWRERFLALRLSGLEKDAPRPGRKPKVSAGIIRAVVEDTLHSPAPNAAHWSTRSMAKAHGLSQTMVYRIWQDHNLKPHLVKTFKISRDKHFVEKLQGVAGLYLNPPDKALVLCVDEKSQIQALDRAQPGVPIKKGRCGTMTNDNKRNGTTALFAALSMLDGTVIGDCMPGHRYQEFIRFLKKTDEDLCIISTS
jgi:transposase